MNKQKMAWMLALMFTCGQPLVASAQAVAHESLSAPSLLLAKELPAHVNVADYLISEKYDGVRAFWDGEVLRFRGGGAIAAPAWFTQALPKVALDGELWLGRGQFEATAAIVRRTTPNDADWKRVRYMIFELPNATGTFAERVQKIERVVATSANPQLVAVQQFKLANRNSLQNKLNEIVQAGGEGVMLHLASAPYTTGRSDVLYKLKPRQDAEATVIAHIQGQGKYAGQLGALRVRTTDGREFNVGGGFSDAQRQSPPAIGATITYQYNGLTKNGLPRFVRFLRVREGL
ncbi:DNA ligase [Hydromonas duriensis]|uniref:DNA ligase-1 n=1 Tax=Hydromonas duriensis TaxID=1527608 RepID=A0A4R6Y4N0_9BURK|nr:DNA ligase [Hydromonas duriensis]TDR28990.1 DNA ligase-1 [Hydromonas duriensis]